MSVNVTAPNAVRRQIINNVCGYATTSDLETDAQIEHEWAILCDAYMHLDAMEEFRCGGEESGLSCEYSRNYESEAVATELEDGSFVGWTYWYGGGKHGDPAVMPWIDEAYYVDCKLETRTVRVYSMKDAD